MMVFRRRGRRGFRRPSFRGRRRTSGVRGAIRSYKRKVFRRRVNRVITRRAEDKILMENWVDTQVKDTGVTHVFAGGISKGTNSDQRVGDKIGIKKIFGRMVFVASPTIDDPAGLRNWMWFRMMIWRPKRRVTTASAGNAAYTPLAAAGSALGNRIHVAVADRIDYTVYLDRTWKVHFPVTAANNTGESGKETVSFIKSFSVPFKRPLRVQWNTPAFEGEDGALELMTWPLYLTVWSGTASTVWPVTTAKFYTSFVDV